MSRESWISDNEILKQAFRDAYSARDKEVPLTDHFHARVMGRTRRIGPLHPAAGFWPGFEHLVWRLAPVSCLLVLVLGVFLINTDFDLSYDYLVTMGSEMESRAVAELFALEGQP